MLHLLVHSKWKIHINGMQSHSSQLTHHQWRNNIFFLFSHKFCYSSVWTLVKFHRFLNHVNKFGKIQSFYFDVVFLCVKRTLLYFPFISWYSLSYKNHSNKPQQQNANGCAGLNLDTTFQGFSHFGRAGIYGMWHRLRPFLWSSSSSSNFMFVRYSVCECSILFDIVKSINIFD